MTKSLYFRLGVAFSWGLAIITPAQAQVIPSSGTIPSSSQDPFYNYGSYGYGSTCNGAFCWQMNLQPNSNNGVTPSFSINGTLGSHQSFQNRTQRILMELRAKELRHRQEMEILSNLGKAMAANNSAETILWVQALARLRGTTPQTVLTEIQSIQGPVQEILNPQRGNFSLQEVVRPPNPPTAP
jgi:hypothetical protein